MYNATNCGVYSPYKTHDEIERDIIVEMEKRAHAEDVKYYRECTEYRKYMEDIDQNRKSDVDTSCKLFIGPIPRNVSSTDLSTIFRAYTSGIVECKVVHPRDKRSSSHGFIHYTSVIHADKAIYHIHNQYIWAMASPTRVRVMYSDYSDNISPYGYWHARRLYELNPANKYPEKWDDIYKNAERI